MGVMVAMLVWASRCAWPRGAWRAEAKAQLGPGLAPPGLQVEGGLPPRPPAAEEGGEEGVDLRLVGVEHVVVGGEGDHGGGEAALPRHILAMVTLYRGPCCREGRLLPPGKTKVPLNFLMYVPYPCKMCHSFMLTCHDFMLK